ncbi:hypothetical protein BH10CYA1_BH10CYA1_27330 [soil metagenome]
MMHIKNGKFVFDSKMIREDPSSNLKDLWFREHACVKVYTHWLETLEQPSLIEMANWCLAAHNLNAEKLHAQIVRLGDDVHMIDQWRAIGSIKDMVATSFGSSLAVADLLVMEQDLLEAYMAKLMNFDGENLNLLQHELLPVQHKCSQAWEQQPTQ